MSTRALTVASRLALCVAIVACAAMFVEYRSGAGTFCGAGGGCAQVRESAFSSVFGVPLPNIGLGVFVGLLALSLAASRREYVLLLALMSTVVGIGGAVLIGIQLFELEAICKWCMAIDVAAIVNALLLWALALRDPDEEPRSLRALWAVVGVGAVAGPIVWGSAPSYVEVPDAVNRMMQPGKVNLVVFTDFECPFCRQLHPVLDEIHRLHPDRVVIKRVMVPLPFHPGAEPAALAYLCAPPDKQDALATRMYSATPGELNGAGVIAIAGQMGIERESFGPCLSTAETLARLGRERELFKSAGLKGLPSTYVNHQLVQGADVEGLLAAVDNALAGGSGLDLRWMLLGLALLGLAASAASLAARPVQVRRQVAGPLS